MKKSMLVMVVMLVACVAYASSLSIPWFVDNAVAGSNYPPAAKNMALIYLHNNTNADLDCIVEYYSAEGVFLGPTEAEGNTFYIPARASVAYRPIVRDPATDPGGQESEVALLIPKRPALAGGVFVPGVTGDPPNGSAKIRWAGGPDDVQGLILQASGVIREGTRYISQWGSLLPAGVAAAE